MSEAITKTIEGYCEEISERNDWTTFNINVGSQYPVKLSTKLPALIASARAVGNTPSTWKFKESEGNPNPNRPGSFYMNRYLESVEEGVTVTPEAVHAPIPMGDRDRIITRMACLKAATVLYQGSMLYQGSTVDDPEDAPLAAIKAADRFERWVYRDLDDVPFDDRTPEEQASYEDAVGTAEAEADGIPY